MPLVDITNPAIINFLVENYRKESRLRINWVHKNWDRIQQAATLTREPTNYVETDSIAHSMVEGLATVKRDLVSAGYNRRKTPIRDGIFIPGINNLRHGHSLVDVGLGNPRDDPRLLRTPGSMHLDPVMKPVDPNTKEIIFKPKPVYGKEQYLLKRTKIMPENKYYFCQCSNWDYGWRLGESPLREKPMHGRCWHLTRTLRSRVGPQPDPPYYKSPELPGPAKCPAI